MTETAGSDATEPHDDTPALEVAGALSNGWQSVRAAPGASDEQRANAAAAASALRDELSFIVNAENLVVLTGLGTSLGIASAGHPERRAPKMSDLWDAVEALPEFEPALTMLTPGVVQARNFEHLLSDAQARLTLAPDDATLRSFVARSEEVVLERCNFVDETSDVATHELFLRKVARRSTRLERTQLYTTNYDLAFEVAARRARFNVIDGFGYGGQVFDGASFDIDFVRRRPNEQISLEPNVFHLLKLHGSVDWTGDDVSIKKTAGSPDRPVLIYPSAAKYQLSYHQPYLEFYVALPNGPPPERCRTDYRWLWLQRLSLSCAA